jgi:hypothetical protein
MPPVRFRKAVGEREHVRLGERPRMLADGQLALDECRLFLLRGDGAVVNDGEPQAQLRARRGSDLDAAGVIISSWRAACVQAVRHCSRTRRSTMLSDQ